MTLKTNILLIALVMLAALAAHAQDKGKYIPLFDNIQSDDATKSPKQITNELKIAVPPTYDDIKPSDAITVLKSYYTAGKIRETLEFSEHIQKNLRRSDDDEMRDLMIYRTAALKDGGFDRPADSTVLSFRKKFPFYKIKKDDPPIFKNLMSNYYTRPMMAIGASVSNIFPRIRIDSVFNVSATDTARAIKYSDFKYTMTELFLQYHVTQKVSVSAGIAVSDLEYVRKSGPNTYKDHTRLLYFPVRLSYTFKPIFTAGLTPEVYIGAKAGYTIQKQYDLTIIAKRGSSGIETDTVSVTYKPSLDDKYFNCTLIGGIRLNYNVRRFCFFVEGHLGCALRPLDDQQFRRRDQGMAFYTRVTPDAVTLREGGISIGAKVNFFYKTFTKFDYGY